MNKGKITEMPPPAIPKTLPESAIVQPIHKTSKKVDTSLSSKLNEGNLIIEDIPLSDVSEDVDEESNSAPPIYSMAIIQSNSSDSEIESETKTKAESETKTETETKSETGSETETETKSETESETGSDIKTETENSIFKSKEKELAIEIEEIKRILLEKEEENSKIKEENSRIKEENSKLKEENSKLKEENSKLKEENSKIKEENSKLKEEISSVRTQKEKCEKRYGEINKKNSTLKTQNKGLEERLKKIDKENSELKKKIKSIKERPLEKKGNANELSFTILQSNEMKNFKKGKRIGRGTTSEVYEVIKETKFAMKVLDLETLDIAQKMEKETSVEDDENESKKMNQMIKFFQECEVLNGLDDINIVKTYGFFPGDCNEPPAIVLDYCESNLKKRIKDLSNDERIKIIFDVSSAMKKVHSFGIIHRDLKLENILLDSANVAKLCDFGLCTFIQNDDGSLSHSQMTGSLKYMSPELLNGRTDYDEKVDVFAFGVVVFLILTKGKYPDINFVDVANGKSAEIPSFITNFSSKLISDCWSYNSCDRPSFADICDRLKGNEHKLI
ncbi:hypothetical protein M9Y10_007030 [Tritrichomonas musculus]|uniref:Protein kinase domain-containing protein n=1 Tax=Tritrichomonas musculus TaxID=1915356 RepID=A0ABR2J096_9EUKA